MTDENALLESEIRLLTERIATEDINPFDAYVGHIIKMRRKELKLSQQQVAYLLGVTFQQLQKYEKGTNKISSDKLLDLSYLMKIPQEVFSNGYNLFCAHLKKLIKEENLNKQLKINDSENKHLYLSDKELNQELDKIKSGWEENQETNPLEISYFFNKLTEDDFTLFYQSLINNLENDSLPTCATDKKNISDSEVTQKIFNLYKKAYQNIEKHPFGEVLVKTLD
ncbi:MAG: helix-turn-helix transcriptional regulator [Alphaproteobacteria bacterium]|nr:helix-turn-helix transcriptional regulator [Alphaproteobacteria bacterium]